MVNLQHDIEQRLTNIEKLLRFKFYDEACILTFVYIDYLSDFTNKDFRQEEHKKNYRRFIMEYSDLDVELKFLQIDKFYEECLRNEQIKEKYQTYFQLILPLLERAKNGEAIQLDEFFSLDTVDINDKSYFQDFTIANKIYDLRNSAVHEFRNNIVQDFDSNSPYLLHVNNINTESEGWFVTEIPILFIYKLLINCYKGVKPIHDEFINKLCSE